MDYLDPHKKKQKKTWLMIMYGLLGVAIAIATVVMVYLVNGYSIDCQTGDVIQNGLVYVDSKPESAEIFLNGEKQKGRTDARLVLPSGNYDLELKRNGYRPWKRSFTLEGGSLRRMTYARLVPETLDTEVALELPGMPTMTSQSIDKRWLAMMFSDNPLLLRVVDLNRIQPQLINIQLPLNLLDTKEPGVWEVIDWADDNKTFLAVYKTATTNEYALIDREDGTRAKKIKELFATTPFTEVSLRSRKNDLLYLFDKNTGIVTSANVTDKTATLALDQAISYKSYGTDVLLYVTKKNASAGKVWVVLRNDGVEYPLKELTEDTKYLLEISKLGGGLVMGIGSPVENRIVVYNDPINALKENDISNLPVPTTVLRVDSPEDLSISADSSVLLIRSAGQIASHEFDADRSYNFVIDGAIDVNQKLHWLDGQHFLLSVAGTQVMVDFDGSNQYSLSPSDVQAKAYFDPTMDSMYGFVNPVQEGFPYRMNRSFMRTAADR